MLCPAIVEFAGKNQTDKLQVKMKRATQASLTDMFNKMSKVSKPSEEMMQVNGRDHNFKYSI